MEQDPWVESADVDRWVDLPPPEGGGRLYDAIGVSRVSPYDEVVAAAQAYINRADSTDESAAVCDALIIAFGNEKSRASYDSLIEAVVGKLMPPSSTNQSERMDECIPTWLGCSKADRSSAGTAWPWTGTTLR